MAELAATQHRSFGHRVIGAVALKPATFEDVEADPSAVTQAMVVVILSSVAAGIGARGFGAANPAAVAFYSAVALMAWAAWALLTYEIGARILPSATTHADVGELLRTTGFAAAPGMIRVLGLIPGLTTPIFVIAAVWMLLAMIVAVRQALDYANTRRAIAVCVVAWALTIVFSLVMGVFFAPAVS